MKQNKGQNTNAVKHKSKSTDGNFLLPRIERRLLNNERLIFYTLCFLCLLFSFFLFNARVSEGNDDSLYIEAGYNYAHNFSNYSYTANAPMYPLFLGGLTVLFGINLIAFKLFSVLFNFLGVVFLYKSFKGRVPYIILFTVCFTVAINSYFQYFASQTYTESLFLALQFIFLYYFFRLLDKNEKGEDLTKRKHLGLWLNIGGLLFLLIMARNAAVAAIPAIILFFIFIKKHKYILWAIGSFLVFKIPYEIIHSFLWKQKDQFSSQFSILKLKDPYMPNKGEDDLLGFVSRFFDNIQLYLSKRFFQVLGFFSENYNEVNLTWAIVVIALIVIGFIKALRSNNRVLFFAVLYMSSLVALTFIMLQARWDQPRLIMIHMPIMLITILYGIFQWVKNSPYAQNLFVLICLIILSSSFISSFKKSANNIPIVIKNLKGDKYFGYTPDWKNFFKMSEWCSGNLPDTALVASRKASMSFIYGNGKKFFPVYKVFALDTTTGYSNPDSVLAYFRRNKVTHVVLASLRRDPAKADGNVINTLHRMMEPIAKKYPEKIKLIHQIPSPVESQIEPAFLYQINY
ncbi:MAG: hypothetical protein HYU69_08240 [Bacteroidetes bacterium]|nr:hypothetical protein [Bacteroidota bacterium]